MSRLLSLRRVLPGAVAVALAASACSSTSHAGTSSATTATSAANLSPITLYGIFDITGPPGGITFPEEGAGFTAAVKAINAKGGINGHPINGVVCDDQLNSTAAANCANNAVSSGSAAVIEVSQEIATTDPILIAGKLPLLEFPLAMQQLAEPTLYEAELGSAGANAEFAVIQHEVFKTTKNVYAGINVAAALASIPAWNATFTAHGWPTGRVVLTPPGIPDAAPYASTILQGGTESVVLASDAGDDDLLQAAIRQAGSNVPTVRSSLTTSSKDISTLGSNATNMFVGSGLLPPSDTSNPTVQAYVSQINAVSSTAAKDEASEWAWMNVYLFAQAAKYGSTYAPADITQSLNTHTFNLGLLPPVQFSTPVAGCGYPRCFNDWATATEVKNGDLVSANNYQFFNLFGPSSTASAAGRIG